VTAVPIAASADAVTALPDPGLFAAVVETLYNAWQRNQTLDLRQVVTRSIAGWEDATPEDVHIALAELEHRGMAEMIEPGRWRRGESPHRPAPLAACQEPACRRPLGHGYSHLPTLKPAA